MSSYESESPANTEDAVSEEVFWAQDRGTLEFDARRALLQLIRGPMITIENNSELWRALLNHRKAIESRLSDMFLELVVDLESGIAFVKNPASEEDEFPKAVRSQPLTLLDTVLVLHLRKELLAGYPDRVFLGRGEFFEQLSPYRPVMKLDESAYRKRLENSWSKLSKAGILQASESEDRFEISPVLKLIFGADEVRALNTEFEELLKESFSESMLDGLSDDSPANMPDDLSEATSFTSNVEIEAGL